MSDGQPKYWDGESVVTGAPVLRSAEVPVESLCGTYRWLCQWGALDSDVSYPTNEFTSGFLTLSLQPSSEPTAANIGGSLRVWKQNGHFTSLEKADHRADNSWDIENVQWAELSEKELDEVGPQKLEQEDEHGFSVLDVQDDNGNPFITFYVNLGWCGCSPLFLCFFGKKERDEDVDVRGAEKLSEAERKRLNWDMGDEDVKRRWGNQPGSGEEQSKIDKSGSEGGSDEEDRVRAAAGQKVNDVAATTGKRKAEVDVDGAERKLTMRCVIYRRHS